GTSLFLFNQTKFSLPEKAFIATLISIVVVNCGVLFENKPWVVVSEWIRIILYPALLITLTLINGWTFSYIMVAIAYFIVSTVWFYFLPKRNAVLA
ncbi:MAG TPA: hypothetical protein VG737_12815, partial [Cyclobacteriaceae bacterium]|nr:hypothetical protein [Cyclobacteriaceae bacterium]